MIVTLLTALYVVCAVLVAAYSVGAITILVAYLRHRHETPTTPHIDDLPTVAVQLPIYNERYVVERLLNACARLDYPRDRLVIQVLDDSTDETTAILARSIAALQRSGLNIQHVRREKRVGYKAGALAYGMTLLDSEYVAVFDADFVPPPGFLRDTVPFMVSDPSIGMVQTRWGHLNAAGNLLTMAQTLALDAHFVIEQTGRNRAGWLINFSGSAGVWRSKTIAEAGGWRDDTLTEDLDLSYRAQLKGWRFLYLPHVVVPGELPPRLSAYKQQQARWAKGSTQCMAMQLGPVWRSPRLTFSQRLMATMHLCQYMNAPFMMVLLLLTPPLLMLSGMKHVPLGPLGLAGLGPPLIYAISQRALYPDWGRRFMLFPALILLGTGMAWNNTRAVVEGLFMKKGEFKRTPKYATTGLNNLYALGADRSILVEGMLSLYALWGAWIALPRYPTLVPYLALYSFAFAVVALWGLSETYQARRVHQAQAQALG